VCCSLDTRLSIGNSGDENIRSWGDVAAGLRVSTLQSEKCIVSHPEGSDDGEPKNRVLISPARLR
jgi:hypothetical protein